MKLIRIIVFLFLLSILTISCSIQSTPRYKSATVSWYGEKFHGRKTANGETYNMRKLTAAHKTLPFGTRVQLTNPASGKKVIVRINDRGPFVQGREFDLSKKAFKKISPLEKGIITVRYKIVR